jgi:hypothetical protein
LLEAAKLSIAKAAAKSSEPFPFGVSGINDSSSDRLFTQAANLSDRELFA